MSGNRNRVGITPSSVVWDSRLPAGLRQADCDRPADELDDAGGNRLWKICQPAQQESLTARFLDSHADQLREALLDLQEKAVDRRELKSLSPGVLLGQMIWTTWIGFRDRALREMHGRGELNGRRVATTRA